MPEHHLDGAGEQRGDAGEPVKLSDFRGKPVVLYIYPADDTPTLFLQ